ncbi:cytochrome C biogenesis protein CcdA [Campylobacterota bacterium]|nr:cytochrome C biogenesis protein CcdA [Campylobacterota bacterium]
MLEQELFGAFHSAPFIASFLAGVVSFLAPCHLSLVPSYLSYISGLSIREIEHAENISRARRLRVVFAAFLFIAGFSTVFISIGVLGDLLIGGEELGYWFNRPLTAIIGGVVIIVFALHFMHIINIPFLNTSSQTKFAAKASFLAPYMLGISFAVGWTPCTGPILGAIAMMSFQEGLRGDAVLLMSLFSLGLGVPFMLLALITTWSLGVLSKIKRYFRAVEIAGGLLLFAIGAYYVYNGASRWLAI